MKLTDVRRLTGVNFLMNETGAAAEAEVPDAAKSVVGSLWQQRMRELFDAVGWSAERVAIRSYPGGITLFVSAPRDTLFTATDMIEYVWECLVQELSGAQATSDLSDAVERFNQEISEETNPAVQALCEAAVDHDVSFLGDDGTVTLGLGKGSQSWTDDDLPTAQSIDWSTVHDIPLAMVTGTNGKSTTVRLAAAIGQEAGLTVGLSSSDWVRVGHDILDEGDYSGPAGAKLAVRDQRADMAIIEAARGGMMRRGLPIAQADVCLITNVAADHLGTYGITDVASLADAKFLLAKAVKPDGRLILNNDDPEVVNRAGYFDGDITWYGLDFDVGALEAWINAGGHAVFVRDGNMMLAKDGDVSTVLPVVDFPPGLRGAAKFNVSNALAAIAIASAFNLPVASMTKALASFQSTPEENPGRGNFLEIGGVSLLVDFAHNPHGLLALGEAIKAIPAKRKAIIIGQAGDRSDDDIADVTEAIWNIGPDMFVIKELETKLRGRAPGEIPAKIMEKLTSLGVSDDAMLTTDSELASVYATLEWAEAGDFLVLLLHGNRKEALSVIENLKKSNWQAGDPVPRAV
jgi:cyanophycin synthetase